MCKAARNLLAPVYSTNRSPLAFPVLIHSKIATIKNKSDKSEEARSGIDTFSLLLHPGQFAEMPLNNRK